MTESDTEYPSASTFGYGLVLKDDGDVSILITLGESDDDGNSTGTLAGIVLEPEMAEFFVARLQAVLNEVEIAKEAVRVMGPEAASEYMQNWAKRINSALN